MDGERASGEAAAPSAGARPSGDATQPASPREEPVPVQTSGGGDTLAATGRALAALRFSYPWLTAAIVAAGLWNAVAFASPWRSRPGDLWLAVTWLIGAACLHLAARRDDAHASLRSRVYLALLGALALSGLAGALLAALQASSLLS